MKLMHYGNRSASGFTFLQIKLSGGNRFDILWTGDGDPPVEGWWNRSEPVWHDAVSWFLSYAVDAMNDKRREEDDDRRAEGNDDRRAEGNAGPP